MQEPIDRLEGRRLLSIVISRFELQVRGTSEADVIEFQPVAHSRSLQVRMNGEVSGPYRKIDGIRVEGLGGDDLILLNELGRGRVGINYLYGGKGDDTIYGSANRDHIKGGDGDDLLAGGDGVDFINGERGDDKLLGGWRADFLDGGAGHNTLQGGEGNDFLEARDGTDVFSGGPGIDWVSYEFEYGPKAHDLSLTLDGVANDGAPNERDQIMRDVENVQGGDGNDLIVGDGLNNRLMGGYGADTIHGGGGSDVIADGVCSHGPSVRRPAHCLWRERPFADELFGDGGNDTLMAYSGRDALFGGAGNDRMELVGLDDPSVSRFLDGGIGTDEALLKPGPDSIVNVENVLDQHGRPVR